MEDETRRPGLSHIGAARDVDVVESRGRRFLNTWLARRIDVVDIVCERIGHNGTRRVVEGCVAGHTPLPDDRITDLLPGEAVIIGALDANDHTAARVAIRDIDVRPVGGDPLTVCTGAIDN